MATQTNQLPKNIPICRTRGDDEPIIFTLSSGGSALDVSGMTFILTIDTLEEPPDNTTNVGSLSSTFVTDGTDGKIMFSPDATIRDLTANIERFYDVQRTDGSGKKKTIIKSTWDVAQDITKV